MFVFRVIKTNFIEKKSHFHTNYFDLAEFCSFDKSQCGMDFRIAILLVNNKNTLFSCFLFIAFLFSFFITQSLSSLQ